MSDFLVESSLLTDEIFYEGDSDGNIILKQSENSLKLTVSQQQAVIFLLQVNIDLVGNKLLKN